MSSSPAYVMKSARAEQLEPEVRAIIREVIPASLALIGIGVGIVGAVGLTTYIQSLLFDVGQLDVLAFAGMAAVMAGVALLASYVPALRASRVDPLVALRAE